MSHNVSFTYLFLLRFPKNVIFDLDNRHFGCVANVLRFLIGDHSGPPLHASLAAKFAARTPALANYAALGEI